jgi:hypothetical protein
MGTARESMRLADFSHEKWVVTNAAFEPMPHAFTMPGLAVPRPSIATNSAILRNTLVASDDFLAVLAAPQLITLRNQNLNVKVRSIALLKIFRPPRLAFLSP